MFAKFRIKRHQRKKPNKQTNNNNNVPMLDVRPLSALTTTLNFLSEIYSFLSSLTIGKQQGNNDVGDWVRVLLRFLIDRQLCNKLRVVSYANQ